MLASKCSIKFRLHPRCYQSIYVYSVKGYNIFPLNLVPIITEYSRYVRVWTTKETWFNSRQKLKLFSSSQRAVWFWNPSNLLSSLYLDLFPRKYSGRSENLTFDLCTLLTLLRMSADVHLPNRWRHGWLHCSSYSDIYHSKYGEFI